MQSAHSPGEEQALGSQLVEVRGLDDRMPHEAVVQVALVIADDRMMLGRVGAATDSAAWADARESIAEKASAVCFCFIVFIADFVLSWSDLLV